MKNLIIVLFISVALNAFSQQLSWKYNFGGNSNLIKAVIHNGIAYLVSDEGVLSLVDTKSGKLNWSFNAGAPLSLPPVVENNVAYLCTKKGDVIALDISTRKIKWTKNTADKLICTPLIYNEMLIVYSKNFILAYDKEVGLDLWKTELKISGKPNLLLADDVFYFSDNMKIYAFMAKTGKALWEYKLAVYGHSDIAMSGDKIYIVNKDKLFVVDRLNGKELFKRDLTTDMTANQINTPFVIENQLYITSANELFCFSADKATEIWHVKLKTQNELFPPVVVANKIYIPERSNIIHVYLPEKGKRETTFTLPIKIESEVVIENQNLYFTTSDGNFVAFKLIESK